MSWMEQLYKTYENSQGEISNNPVNENHNGRLYKPLVPPYHTLQNSHIEICLDGYGNFITADPVAKREREIIIPCTEKSENAKTGRNPPSHPLCEMIKYCAKDYVGNKNSYFETYIKALEGWATSAYSHVMVNAVYKYIKKGTVLEDLNNTGKQLFKDNDDPGDYLVRWKVEIPGEEESRCWKCETLFKSWQEYAEKQDAPEGLCMVLGVNKNMAINHPKRIRNSGDGGKLISSNDKTGFTFLGRFGLNKIKMSEKEEDVAIQALSISTEVSQKAHSALRWLIDKQGYKNDTQVIVAWAVSGKNIPPIFTDSLSLFDETDEEKIDAASSSNTFDAGELFARKLRRKIAGYEAVLGDSSNIVILGLDSLVTGRVAVTFYRELETKQFLEAIENWHKQFAWHFKSFTEKVENGKKSIRSGYRPYAPSPDTIAEICYNRKQNTKIDQAKKMKRMLNERLLPCIIDGVQIPRELVDISVRRASNKIALEENEWEKTLSVACALYKGFNSRNFNDKRDYEMALENERTDRDYLYGRLLAVAERIEDIALFMGKENRPSTATRMMQKFSMHPFSTWKIIESSLVPYEIRLQSKRPEFLKKMKSLLDVIHSMFGPGDFEKELPLSGAYLLGYHCQRLELRSKKEDETNNNKNNKEFENVIK